MGTISLTWGQLALVIAGLLDLGFMMGLVLALFIRGIIERIPHQKRRLQAPNTDALIQTLQQQEVVINDKQISCPCCWEERHVGLIFPPHWNFSFCGKHSQSLVSVGQDTPDEHVYLPKILAALAS